MGAVLAGVVSILQAAAAAASAAGPPAPSPRHFVYPGPPQPDPRVAAVGDCVWDSVARQPAPAATPESFLPNTYNVVRWDGPRISIDQTLRDALAACDPHVAAHRWYSVLSVAAAAQKRAALARLQAEGVDEARLDKAWARAPAELHQQVRKTVEQWLDGRPSPLDADWTPFFRAVGLRRAPLYRGKPQLPVMAEITPAQASARDYVFGREFAAGLAEKMARAPDAAPAGSLPPGTWPLDTPLPADVLTDYYPETARAEGKQGFGRVECKVTDMGDLAGCTILQEAPEGLGFGRATAAAVRRLYHFRMDGSAPDLVPGTTVRQTIRWTLPQ